MNLNDSVWVLVRFGRHLINIEHGKVLVANETSVAYVTDCGLSRIATRDLCYPNMVQAEQRKAEIERGQ